MDGEDGTFTLLALSQPATCAAIEAGGMLATT